MAKAADTKKLEELKKELISSVISKFSEAYDNNLPNDFENELYKAINLDDNANLAMMFSKINEFCQKYPVTPEIYNLIKGILSVEWLNYSAQHGNDNVDVLNFQHLAKNPDMPTLMVAKGDDVAKKTKKTIDNLSDKLSGFNSVAPEQKAEFLAVSNALIFTMSTNFINSNKNNDGLEQMIVESQKFYTHPANI